MNPAAAPQAAGVDLLDDLDTALAAAFERQDRASRPLHRARATLDGDAVVAGRRADPVLLERDRLGRAADATAIAELICLRDAPLPLAFGLFGNWGAGKSTFMAMVEAAIDRTAELAETVRDADGRPAFVRNIVHIRFNAWHYAEGNLWASIGTHVFQELERQSRREEKRDWLKETQLDGLIRRLDSVRAVEEETTKALAKAEVTQAELEKNLEKVNLEISKLERDAALAGAKALQLTLGEALHEKVTSSLRGLGVDTAEASLEPIETLVEESARVGGRLRLFARSLAATPGRTLAYLGLGVAVFAAVAFLAALAEAAAAAQSQHLVLQAVRDALDGVRELLAGVSGVAASLLAGLRNLDARLAPLLEAHETLLKQQGDALEGAREEAVELKGKIAALESERDGYLLAREAALRERTSLEAMRRGERPSQLLSHYIAERAEARDYRKHLGLVSLLARDFQQMSELMAEQRRLRDEGLEQAIAEDLPRIDRIVLYIDDLDRCPHATVVRVLEAVHLLLAYPLFVVVVGVDPRWLQVSLSKHYADQLGEGGDRISVWDYLEKIFQIPYHLLPPTTPQAQGGSAYLDLVAGIVGEVQAEPASPPGGQDPARPGAAPGGDPLAPGPGGGRVLRRLTPVEVVPPPSEPPPTPEQVLDRVTLTRAELLCLQGLGPLAGTSPRTAKRVVNLYRIIRARWPADRLDEFLGRAPGHDAEFPAVMFLLATDAGLDSADHTAFMNLLSVCGRRRGAPLGPDLASALKAVAKSDSSKAAWSDMAEAMSRLHPGSSWEQARRVAGDLASPAGLFQQAVLKATGAVPPLLDQLATLQSHPVVAPYGFREPGGPAKPGTTGTGESAPAV